MSGLKTMAKNCTYKGTNPDALEAGPRQFFEGMMRMSGIIALSTKGEIESVEISGKKRLKVKILVKKISSSGITPQRMLHYARQMVTHFLAFYTPTHYEKHHPITANRVGMSHKIMISGKYTG